MKPSSLPARDTPEDAQPLRVFFSREQAAAACLRAKRERRVERLITAMQWLCGAMVAALILCAWKPSDWAALAACLLGADAAALFIVTVILGCRLDGRGDS